MKYRKQLLADFYLKLLAIKDEPWRSEHQALYAVTLLALAEDLREQPDTIQNIFERMAAEDA